MITTPMPAARVSIQDLELDAADLDPHRAAAIYREHGCVVVRGLARAHVPAVRRDIDAAAARALSLLPFAEKVAEGWVTPDQALFLPAPAGHVRDKQIMLLNVTYSTSAALLRSATDDRLLDIVEAALGPEVELFMHGQVVYKEAVGGHPKHLHQDAAYFEHRHQGPLAALCYAVDTDLRNGALHVVPGSHRLGVLKHTDTFSHLGLDATQWPWERALPITGRAGDVICFHANTIHGSRENRSTAPRPVFIHRYRRADDYVVVGGTTLDNRGQREQARTTASKAGHYGLMVRGTRSFQAEDADLLSPPERLP
jgi:ectoine hydroxylase-related dioxygenase (phytanoyl-CoA dioxygenase family)